MTEKLIIKKKCLHKDSTYELFKITGTNFESIILFTVKDVQNIEKKNVIEALNAVKSEINNSTQVNNTKLIVNLINSKNLKMSFLPCLKHFLKEGRPIFKIRLDSSLVVLPNSSDFWQKLFKILLYFVPSSRPITFKKQNQLTDLYAKLLK